MRTLLRFGKNSRLRFVSHLDLQRFFQRALNRTGLPIAFSQGFNPHAVMSFASALAVGVIVTSLTTGMTTDVDSYMFGSILAMDRADVALSVGLSIAVLALFVLFYHRLFAYHL